MATESDSADHGTDEVVKGAGSGPEKRGRHLKKDAKEKAKQKLWDSIIKETDDEADSDSSDEDHI